jgi:hypothetical protein
MKTKSEKERNTKHISSRESAACSRQYTSGDIVEKGVEETRRGNECEVRPPSHPPYPQKNS